MVQENGMMLEVLPLEAGGARLVCWELCWGLYVVGVYLIYLEEEKSYWFLL